jgi:serine protease
MAARAGPPRVIWDTSLRPVRPISGGPTDAGNIASHAAAKECWDMTRARWSRALALAAAAFGLACGSGGGSGDDAVLGGRAFTVSGTMLATSGSAIDSDTSDPSAPFTRNDSAAQSQEIGNPVMLGGHANVPGAGAPLGRTTASGDTQDWFRVSIADGQTIRLQIAEDGDVDDLDLELRMLDESLVDSSETSSRTEEITVPDTGDYYVVVVAVSGASSYTLTIGQTQAAAAGAGSEPEFVPGQVIVRYRDTAGARTAGASGSGLAGRVGMRHVSGTPGGPMVFAAETLAERRAAFAKLGLAPTPEMRGVATSRGARGLRDDTKRIAEALSRRADVRSADLNYVRHATAVPADALYPFQWHYDQINLPQAWDTTLANSGVVVAVLDTGIKAHADLTGQLVGGYDFISDPATANDGNGCDPDADDAGDQAPGGSSFHGTHVTGTVAARTSFASGNSDGVAGVAWNAQVMPLRVLGVGGGTDSDIMAALRYAAGRAGTCAGAGAPTPARVVNMSLGGPGFSQTFQDLITDLRINDDMIFVAAAGNEANTQAFFPAAYDGVISVSAVGPTNALAPYSSFGSTIDVAAPGGDFQRDVDGDGYPDGVLSTYFAAGTGFGYAFFQGTSMASPHVAGVIALMLGINPALTPFDIDNALNTGQITDEIGSAQLFGNGLIDAAKAVIFAVEEDGGSTTLLPVLRVSPDGLNYGFLASDFRIAATNGGNDQEPLEMMNITFTSDDGADWLTVTPLSVDAQGLGTYRALVSRTGLADGLYTGTIEFESDRNTVEVPVIMQVGDPSSTSADAGHHYILLLDPETFDVVDEFQANAVNGAYPFSFVNVRAGDYVIVAGTDSDADLLVCDPGEACGAFPTTETIVPITVNANRTGLSFVTGFAADVSTSAASADASAPAARGYSRGARAGAGQ